PAVNNLMLSLAINSGTFDTLVAPQMGAGAELIKTQLLSTPPALFLLAGVERACALAIQVALSLLVLAAVRGGGAVHPPLARRAGRCGVDARGVAHQSPARPWKV